MAVFIKREPCDEPSSTHELQPPPEPVLAEPVPLTSAVLLPKAITSSSAAVLPVAITTAVLEILVRKGMSVSCSFKVVRCCVLFWYNRPLCKEEDRVWRLTHAHTAAVEYKL